MRNSKMTRYTKSIAIAPEDLKYLVATKGKKSRAGRLAEIIADYRARQPQLTVIMKLKN